MMTVNPLGSVCFSYWYGKIYGGEGALPQVDASRQTHATIAFIKSPFSY